MFGVSALKEMWSSGSVGAAKEIFSNAAKQSFSAEGSRLGRAAWGAGLGAVVGAGIHVGSGAIGSMAGIGDGPSFGGAMRSAFKGAAVGGVIGGFGFRDNGKAKMGVSRAFRALGALTKGGGASMVPSVGGLQRNFKNGGAIASNNGNRLGSAGGMLQGSMGGMATLGGMTALAANSQALTSRVPSNYGYR